MGGTAKIAHLDGSEHHFESWWGFFFVSAISWSCTSSTSSGQLLSTSKCKAIYTLHVLVLVRSSIWISDRIAIATLLGSGKPRGRGKLRGRKRTYRCKEPKLRRNRERCRVQTCSGISPVRPTQHTNVAQVNQFNSDIELSGSVVAVEKSKK